MRPNWQHYGVLADIPSFAPRNLSPLRVHGLVGFASSVAVAMATKWLPMRMLINSFCFFCLHVGGLHPPVQFLGSICIHPILIPPQLFNDSACVSHSFPTEFGRHSLAGCVCVVVHAQFVHCSIYWWRILEFVPAIYACMCPLVCLHFVLCVSYCRLPRLERCMRLLESVRKFIVIMCLEA